jgi:uncharacterized protein with PQ loop repeat
MTLIHLLVFLSIVIQIYAAEPSKTALCPNSKNLLHSIHCPNEPRVWNKTTAWSARSILRLSRISKTCAASNTTLQTNVKALLPKTYYTNPPTNLLIACNEVGEWVALGYTQKSGTKTPILFAGNTTQCIYTQKLSAEIPRGIIFHNIKHNWALLNIIPVCINANTCFYITPFNFTLIPNDTTWILQYEKIHALAFRPPPKKTLASGLIVKKTKRDRPADNSKNSCYCTSQQLDHRCISLLESEIATTFNIQTHTRCALPQVSNAFPYAVLIDACGNCYVKGKDDPVYTAVVQPIRGTSMEKLTVESFYANAQAQTMLWESVDNMLYRSNINGPSDNKGIINLFLIIASKSGKKAEDLAHKYLFIDDQTKLISSVKPNACIQNDRWLYLVFKLQYTNANQIKYVVIPIQDFRAQSIKSLATTALELPQNPQSVLFHPYDNTLVTIDGKAQTFDDSQPLFTCTEYRTAIKLLYKAIKMQKDKKTILQPTTFLERFWYTVKGGNDDDQGSVGQSVGVLGAMVYSGAILTFNMLFQSQKILTINSAGVFYHSFLLLFDNTWFKWLLKTKNINTKKLAITYPIAPIIATTIINILLQMPTLPLYRTSA